MSNDRARGITRDNHYIPQFLLRNWTADARGLFVYRLLVPFANVPEWQQKSARSVGFRDDLYTMFSEGEEVDEFEHWCGQEFETPAAPAVHKIVSNARVGRDDWRHIAQFVALQDLRTPLGFLGLRRIWERIVPGILESTLKETFAKLEEAHTRGQPLVAPRDSMHEFDRIVRLQIERPNDEKSTMATVRATVPAGRRLWLQSVRNLMANGAKVLAQHRWSIAEPWEGLEWPLPDHPVLRLNWNSESDYTFDGGWNFPGSEIMMPLSPRHLLYVKVGTKMRNRFTFSQRATELVQRLLVERAHHYVFATAPQDWVPRMRPRVVDATVYAAEEQGWRHWHAEQVASEAELDSSSSSRTSPGAPHD